MNEPDGELFDERMLEDISDEMDEKMQRAVTQAVASSMEQMVERIQVNIADRIDRLFAKRQAATLLNSGQITPVLGSSEDGVMNLTANKETLEKSNG